MSSQASIVPLKHHASFSPTYVRDAGRDGAVNGPPEVPGIVVLVEQRAELLELLLGLLADALGRETRRHAQSERGKASETRRAPHRGTDTVA